tara:strand:- start:1431 stop:1790 length:360 start_codon:yes stop_codon:yes gene_type:complete
LAKLGGGKIKTEMVLNLLPNGGVKLVVPDYIVPTAIVWSKSNNSVVDILAVTIFGREQEVHAYPEDVPFTHTITDIAGVEQKGNCKYRVFNKGILEEFEGGYDIVSESSDTREHVQTSV